MKLGEEKVLEKLRLPPLDPLQATDPMTRRLPSAHWVQVLALLFTLGQAASVLQYLFPPLRGGEGQVALTLLGETAEMLMSEQSWTPRDSVNVS